MQIIGEWNVVYNIAWYSALLLCRVLNSNISRITEEKSFIKEWLNIMNSNVEDM